jgi:hypothetical protein
LCWVNKSVQNLTVRNPPVLKKLRAAVEAEKDSVATRLLQYRDLSEKMRAYQEGTGPAPTSTEFENWCAAVALAVKLRQSQILSPPSEAIASSLKMR